MIEFDEGLSPIEWRDAQLSANDDEIASLKERLAHAERRAEAVTAEMDELKAERDRLREALKWYASPGNYAILSGSDYQMYASRTMIDHDGGDRARAALTPRE